jgi:hypothetical protein
MMQEVSMKFPEDFHPEILGFTLEEQTDVEWFLNIR